MTDTQTTAPAPTEGQTVDLSKMDKFIQQFAARLVGQIEEHNGIVAKIKATSTNLDDLMDAVRAGDDPKVTKAQSEIDALNERLEKAETALREYVKSQAERMLADRKDTDTSDLEAQRDALNAQIQQGVRYLSGETKIDKKDLPLPKVATLRGMSSGEGNGAGGRRLRGFILTVDGKDALLGGKSSFSAAAKVIGDGVSTAQVQDAYFEAVGTTDSDKFPPSATFTVNGKTVVAVKVPSEVSVS